MSDAMTLIDHEKRLTAMEITTQNVVNMLTSRVQQLEAEAEQRRVEAEQAGQRELRAQVDALTEERNALRKMIEDDPKRTATVGAKE